MTFTYFLLAICLPAGLLLGLMPESAQGLSQLGALGQL